MTADFDDNIGDIIEGSKDTMMNMIYKAIVNNEQDALSSNTPSQEKLSALMGVLQYFEGTEEYEKCYNIKKIMDKIC
jgi:hypothetical protein